MYYAKTKDYGYQRKKNTECAQKERAIESNENGGFSCNFKGTNNLILGYDAF